MDTNEPDLLDDPRVFHAVQEYLAALEAGRRPDPKAFLAQHADIAPALAECLDGIDLLHTAGPKIRDASPPAPATELPTALGDFRIVRELGRGGMGVVYEAVQLSLGRRVALKVLPFAAALDARQLQRFKTEAQAAAHLHHPHIVPVHAVGCERGVHYYAMQLIDGQNLAAVVDELRHAPHSPPSAPTGDFPAPAHETRSAFGAQFTTLRTHKAVDFHRGVTRLAAQAAEALEYAHQNGVVHRDIKPANLLVDAGGNLWITDFGLAQVQADAGLTQTGDLLGTLRYMSPEQAGGPRGLIDHRTDVYSLGATLYELLTLRPIFDGTDRRALLNQIMNEEPRPPRAIDKAIPADLETIVLKAINKHPADRYTTAQELADDLNRFLKHEPIRARRATTVQRVRKWLRRHPGVPVAAAVLLVLLTAVSLVSAVAIRSEQEKTRAALLEERQRAREADERLRLARRSVDDMIQTAEGELGDNPAMQGLRKKLLETALAYYQEFVRQRSDDPEMQADLAATRDKVRRILADLAELEGAGHLFLLNDHDVLTELGVSEEKRTELNELNRRLGEQRAELFRDFRHLSPEEKRARFLEVTRANEAGAAAILATIQMARLRQIALQSKGMAAFREPTVIAALKLSPDQQKRLRVIEADAFMGLIGPTGPIGQPRTGGPPPGMRKGPEDFWKPTFEKALAELSDEQKRQWTELTGQPFARRKMPFRGGPPGGFGGHPGGPGRKD